jgi:tetratricopeptide (TPR) repeat protein
VKRSFAFFALLLVAFVFSTISFATPREEWITVKSKNFHLIGNAGEKEVRLVATKLEQFRETFRMLFPGLKVDSPTKTTVIVFKNDLTYRPFKPRRGDGKPDDGIAGYFQPGEDVNYITLSTAGENVDTFGTIFHEYTHFMLDTSVGKGNVPVWFNEGMAEYYQTFKIAEDQKVTLGLLQDSHLRLLQQTKLIPLKQFFEVDSYSLHSSGDHSRSIFYAQAWALIHYLIQGNNGKSLQQFLSLVLKDLEPEAAFKEAFNSDYATMEKELNAYIAKNKFTASLFSLKEKLVFDAEMSVSPLSEENANAYLGDLLLHIRAYDAAEAQLRKTLDVNPANSMANVSMGLVKFRQRDFPQAKKYLEQAITSDQKNHFAHYNYALVLSRESVDEFGYIQKFPEASAAKMRASLAKAIELDPQFGESYRLMALISLVNGDNLDEALRYIKRGLSIQPGAPDYMMLEAKILMRQEKYENARNVAERVAKTTDDKEVKTEAESLIKSIQQVVDAKAAYERQAADVRSQYEAQARQLGISGSRPPVILKRKDVTDEQLAKIEKDREIANINRLIPKLQPGESRVIGQIESIICRDSEIKISVRAAGGKLLLSAADFQSLNLMIFKEGTQNFEIGCGADLSAETIVVTYKAAEKVAAGMNGRMIAGAFVPGDFRLMTSDELNNAPLIIVEGGPPSDLSKNARRAEEEQIDFEKKRREMMMRQLQQALREPLAGEQRIIGTVEKVECAGASMTALVGTDKGPLKLSVSSPKQLRLMVFTQNMTSMRFGCGESYPNVKAVITYLPSLNKKPKYVGDLRALEFVPPSFTLPAVSGLPQ